MDMHHRGAAMLLIDEQHGKTIAVGSAYFGTPQISVRELIRARVELEYQRVEQRVTTLISPFKDSREARLNVLHNPFKTGVLFGAMRAEMPIDNLVAFAESGFAAQRFILLVADRQAESLDDVINVSSTAEALFLLLTPLKGG